MDRLDLNGSLKKLEQDLSNQIKKLIQFVEKLELYPCKKYNPHAEYNQCPKVKVKHEVSSYPEKADDSKLLNWPEALLAMIDGKKITNIEAMHSQAYYFLGGGDLVFWECLCCGKWDLYRGQKEIKKRQWKVWEGE